jgi:L-histidine N-alpha-methyltransferase
MSATLQFECTTPARRPSGRRHEPLPAALIDGLRDEPKRISPSYFYDARGSKLLDAICELPEYYLTRTESRILEAHAAEIAGRMGENALLVEYGSGASAKTRLLLDHLRHPSAYVPVDISRAHLTAAANRISQAYPGLEVLPVCTDFARPFELPQPKHPPARNVVFFPGSTIGNFEPQAAIDLMRQMRSVAGAEGAMLIGTDLVKDRATLLRAYDDSAGVTAQFNLNVLRRLNRQFGADFDLDAFRHEAIWRESASCIEMRLVSLRDQMVHLAGESIPFAAGERLVTEQSHKYTFEGFREQALAAGWLEHRVWLDDRRYFAVHYLEPARAVL